MMSVEYKNPDADCPVELGMSLRDYFASNIMMGLCANPSLSPNQCDDFVDAAYFTADKMLKRREKK